MPKNDIEAFMKNMESKVPVPKCPPKEWMEIFDGLLSMDLDTLDDNGPNGISRALNISTSVSAYISYSLGKARAALAYEKNAKNKAEVEYLVGLDNAYQRIVSSISREISLRRDSFERARVDERPQTKKYPFRK